jgi:prepilin-type N-terminal cleavage/methylation domain-containing protein
MNQQNGFTLVELLVVMVIVGILAAIALPKLNGAREKAFVSSMESDLRNLSSSQEIYHSNHRTYSNDITQLTARVSEGVTLSVVEVTNTSWSALATHSSTPRTCALYYGDDVAPVAPATQPNVVTCDP